MTGRYFPDWDRDVAFGELMELEVEGVLSVIRNGGYTQETKADRYANGSMFLEWEHDPRRLGKWKPSGLQTTKAALFIYAHGHTCIEVWRTEPLRQVVAGMVEANPRCLIVGGGGGDCPTRGVKTNKFEVLYLHRRAAA